jgi:hypothetical protein
MLTIIIATLVLPAALFWRISMAKIRGTAHALCTIGSALLLLTGCDKMAATSEPAADWARAALERNENLTVVAFDKNANTFTVKMKDTGELHIVRVDQIVGSVPGVDASKPQPVSNDQTPAGEITANTSQPADRSATVGEIARPAQDVEASADAPKPGSGTGVITDPATGKVLASNDSTQAVPGADGKRVLASGPGYSVSAGEGTPPAAVRLASSSTQIPSPARGVAVERRYEPMICQGQQLMHIDGRNLEFEGDALKAEGGCEIHITNSHIIAHGVGVSARAANVHIKNSVVEGDSGSISASEGAQVYTQQSTFKGLSRRLDTASFHDLGGTVWNN